MDELYRQLWELVLAFVTIVGSAGILWIVLDIAAEWAQERAGRALDKRRRSYRRVAARHGRTVRETNAK